MRIIIHGTLDQVAAVTPGPMVLQVNSVSEPYENRKGNPRLHRVYLDGEIVPSQAGGLTIQELVGWLATALENLQNRIIRDLDTDASEGTLPDDPAWAATITEFLGYAEQQLEVLDHPEVIALVRDLTAASEAPEGGERA